MTPGGIYCNPPALLFVEEELLVEDISVTEDDRSFRLYPNPTSGVFTVDVSGFDSDLTSTIEILGIMGERVYHTELQGGKSIRLNLDNIAPGIYIVRLQNGKDVYTDKLIRQ